MNDLFTPHPENKEKDASKRIADLAEQIDKKKNAGGKVPQNIFSRPIDVTQSDAARKSRLKTVIIEALLFGAFLTAITAIYSLTGLDLKFNPEQKATTPSLFFYLAEFVVFSGLVGVGDYFLTEKRVNDYNQARAGLSFNIDEEIKTALAEQEADGITEEDAAALNSSNGEEKPDPSKLALDIKDAAEAKSPTDKAFEAFDGEISVGKIETCKGTILDSNGMETVILKVSEFSVPEEQAKNGVGIRLFGKLKEEASLEGMGVIAVSAEYDSAYGLCLPDASKFGIKCAEGTSYKVCEIYPGALLGVSGEIQ